MLQATHQIDVAEVYSPPRVVEFAKEMGLKCGWSLDITGRDTDGKPWNFSRKEMQDRAEKKVRQDKPVLLIGSPMCTDWSPTMNLNWHK